MSDVVRAALSGILSGETLPQAQMNSVLGAIMEGRAPPELAAGFLCALATRGETVEELAGAAAAMRSKVTQVRTPPGATVVDTCGTGGDGAGTFNISPTTAFVVAACGVTVAKHGNRAVSSKAGSADVLEALGVDVTASVPQVERSLEKVGLGFLFAQRLHPAMKHAAPIRRALGVRTLFNLVGPLTTPAFARRQVMGVFDSERVADLARVLGRLGSVRAWVVHGEDGLDEITLTGRTHVAEWRGGQVRTFDIVPEDAGLVRCSPSQLTGGDAQANARILRRVLDGEERGPGRDIVLRNAAAALVVAERAEDLIQGARMAAASGDEGRAADILAGVRRISRQCASWPTSLPASVTRSGACGGGLWTSTPPPNRGIFRPPCGSSPRSSAHLPAKGPFARI